MSKIYLNINKNIKSKLSDKQQLLNSKIYIPSTIPNVHSHDDNTIIDDNHSHHEYDHDHDNNSNNINQIISIYEFSGNDITINNELVDIATISNITRNKSYKVSFGLVYKTSFDYESIINIYLYQDDSLIAEYTVGNYNTTLLHNVISSSNIITIPSISSSSHDELSSANITIKADASYNSDFPIIYNSENSSQIMLTKKGNYFYIEEINIIS
tara:strand:+ start:4756 stop:5394 length:639 start_codon:yes stop_codon:yes gene_type:complete